jgi:hypothetical protein
LLLHLLVRFFGRIGFPIIWFLFLYCHTHPCRHFLYHFKLLVDLYELDTDFNLLFQSTFTKIGVNLIQLFEPEFLLFELFLGFVIGLKYLLLKVFLKLFLNNSKILFEVSELLDHEGLDRVELV